MSLRSAETSSDPLASLRDTSALVPSSYAEKAMASLLQLHQEVLEEKERRVDLYRRLMEREQSLAELRMYVQMLEDRLARAENRPAPPITPPQRTSSEPPRVPSVMSFARRAPEPEEGDLSAPAPATAPATAAPAPAPATSTLAAATRPATATAATATPPLATAHTSSPPATTAFARAETGSALEAPVAPRTGSSRVPSAGGTLRPAPVAATATPSSSPTSHRSARGDGWKTW